MRDLIGMFKKFSLKQRVLVIVSIFVFTAYVYDFSRSYIKHPDMSEQVGGYVQTARVMGGIKSSTDTSLHENIIIRSISSNSQGLKTPDMQEGGIIATTSDLHVIFQPSQKLYLVLNVIDGDTIDVSIDGVVERLRLIGMDTPETVDPRKPVQCFGKEASDRAKELLTGTRVFLESDPSQGERDKYDRLLRYVFFEDGTSFNQKMIREGYAHEYTYDTPYAYQEEFKKAEQDARESKAGLWGDRCNGDTSSETAMSLVSSQGCTIKGNISAQKEKIYHMIGCGTYNKTVIDESKGERWFCSEQEAIEAGFRKALNCD